MKSLLALVLMLVAAPGAFAQWRLEQSQRQEAPAGLEFVRHAVALDGRSEQLEVVSFSPAAASFAVMDDPERRYTLETAAKKRGALAAVNGGYFQPDRTPLGLVIRQGQQLHALQRSSLLSGMVVVSKGAPRIALQRVAEFKPSANVVEALQAGPFLVDAGKAVVGLNALRVAARTVVFIDSSGRCGFLVCRSATLAETAQIALIPGVVGPGRRIVRALNLDGGSSTGLWVAPQFYQAEGKAVRNFLAIVPQPKAAVAASTPVPVKRAKR